MFDTSLLLIAPLTFGGLLVAHEIGRRLARRRIALDPETWSEGYGAIEGGTFGLLGLLVAFTFSGATNRFDDRRRYVVDEANAIGTAWLRLDLVPAAAQPELRAAFQRYADARIGVYRTTVDLERSLALGAQAEAEGLAIWKQCVAAARDSGSQVSILLFPALNEMLDLANTRKSAALWYHPPWIVFAMLFVAALASALVAGYGSAASRSRDWVHKLAFVATLSLTIYVIIDLEYPRAGFLRVDAIDQVMRDVRASME